MTPGDAVLMAIVIAFLLFVAIDTAIDDAAEDIKQLIRHEFIRIRYIINREDNNP